MSAAIQTPLREPAISLCNVHKVYDAGASAVAALKGMSLDVRRGEVVLLMGPSGSGKTTLLSIMGCILTPTSGRVRIGETDTSGLSAQQLSSLRRQRIGIVFQGFNLFSTLTALENDALALDLRGVARKEATKRAAQLLEEVGLGDKRDTFPADLSGGQKQRVAIARALAGDPEIILCDEPTAALDSASGALITCMLQQLARGRGRTVVIVTHDPRILTFADRVLQMEDGRLIGTPTRSTSGEMQP